MIFRISLRRVEMLNIALLTGDLPLTIATSTLGYLCGAMQLEPIIHEIIEAEPSKSREKSRRLEVTWVVGANFAKGTLAVSIAQLLGAGDLSILAGVGAILGHSCPPYQPASKHHCGPTVAGVVTIICWQAGLILSGALLLPLTSVRYGPLIKLLGFIVAPFLTCAERGPTHVVLLLFMAGVTFFSQRL
jgi:glycerol-3-phosphate acyltransferase PlsY